MASMILFKGPDSDRERIRQAEALDQIATKEFERLTGKNNHMPRHKDLPVVCCAISSAGYWELQCNDPEFSPTWLTIIAGELRKWEGSPLIAGR
jgi:hypothetical protein